MPLGFKNDGPMTQEYTYDVSGGDAGTGTVVLSDKDGVAPLPLGAVVSAVRAKVATAFLAGTSVAWGTAADGDGYSGAAIVTGSLTVNASFNGWDNDSALLWDTVNDHQINPVVVVANDGVVQVTAAGTFTAGKLVLLVEYTFPKERVA